jgi:hypothetical protein
MSLYRPGQGGEHLTPAQLYQIRMHQITEAQRQIDLYKADAERAYEQQVAADNAELVELNRQSIELE